MTLGERVARVGVSLRSVLHHALASEEDREMRRMIAELHKTATAEIEEGRAGRDRALDMLAEDR